VRLVILLLLTLDIYAQNLVANASFEDFVDCPIVFAQTNDQSLVKHWYSPTTATPDYFNNCGGPITDVPVNAAGVADARTGKAYIGMALYVNVAGNYSEYFQTKLLSPLIKDSVYCLTLFYRLASFSMYGSNGMGMLLSNKQIKINSDALLYYNAQVIDSIAPSEDDANTWIKLQGIYKAAGGESYLTIGCFRGMLEYSIYRNLYLPQRKESRNTAYYFVDDVSVMMLNRQNLYSCKDTSLKFDDE
jgi:hypothetical protein